MDSTGFHLAIYLSAGIIGIGFALIVYIWRHFDPDHGVTPWWVVTGCGLSVVFLAILEGIGPAVTQLIILTVLGTPQIAGYYIAHIRRRRERAAETRFEL